MLFLSLSVREFSDLFRTPKMVSNLGFHCRGYSQRFVNATEIVIHEAQRDGALLGSSRYIFHLRISGNATLHRAGASWRAITALSVLEGVVRFDQRSQHMVRMRQ